MAFLAVVPFNSLRYIIPTVATVNISQEIVESTLLRYFKQFILNMYVQTSTNGY